MKISIFYGGRSTEHDASLKSKETICENVTKYEIEDLIFVDRNGNISVNNINFSLGQLIDYIKLKKDVFYINLLHGNEGEDGSWNGLADICDINGSFESVNTSSVLMNKYQQSILAKASCPNLLIPNSILINSSITTEEIKNRLLFFKNKSIIVKPNTMGASHFTKKFEEISEETIAFIQSIFPYDDNVIIQEFVTGEEYTCGVVKINNEIISMPIIHVKSSIEGYLGHTSKHTKNSTHIDFDEFPQSDTIKNISKQLWNVFGIKGMCRFDFIVNSNGDIYFLEGNLIPGFSMGSAFPRMLKKANISINTFVESLIANFNGQKKNKYLPYSIED